MTDPYIQGRQNLIKGENYHEMRDGYYEDGASAPVVQNDYNSKNAYCSNENEGVTINPDNPRDYPCNTKSNDNDLSDNVDNNLNRNQNRRRRRSFHLPEKKIIFSYILIVIAVIDILLQIIFGYVNLYFMSDDIAILGLTSLIIYFDRKKKEINHYILAALTIIIWFCGFGIKGFGLADLYEINTISLIFMGLIFLRSFIMFCFIPIICP